MSNPNWQDVALHRAAEIADLRTMLDGERSLRARVTELEKALRLYSSCRHACQTCFCTKEARLALAPRSERREGDACKTRTVHGCWCDLPVEHVGPHRSYDDPEPAPPAAPKEAAPAVVRFPLGETVLPGPLEIEGNVVIDAKSTQHNDSRPPLTSTALDAPAAPEEE